MLETIIKMLDAMPETAFYMVWEKRYDGMQLIDVTADDCIMEEEDNPDFNEIEWTKFIDFLEKNCIKKISGYCDRYVFNTFQVKIGYSSMDI